MIKKYSVVLLLTIIALSAYSQGTSLTTFIVVRHAEKSNESSSDPSLAPAGTERANKLAALLKEVGVSAIYSTNYKRTKNTVDPLATAKSIAIQDYKSLKEAELDELIKKYSGGTVVIAGHSNTVPGIVNLLIGKEQYKNLDDSNYGALFIVSLAERGKASVTLLTY
jgi:2,3-bisphosphoglycerate-dependent phosphoglycerate mutase